MTKIENSYKFTTPDRVIIISGDNRDAMALAESAKGTDIIFHSVYGLNNFGSFIESPEELQEWKDYQKEAHSSTAQVAELAYFAKPKLLLTYHELRWTNDQVVNKKEIEALYNGRVHSAKDLDVFE